MGTVVVREADRICLKLLMVLVFCLILAPCDSLARNPAWAVPLTVEGLPNLHRVTEYLYRSGHPSAEGLRRAEAMGITTVLSFRSGTDDDKLAQGTGLRLFRVPMRAWNPRYEDAVAALRRLRPDRLAENGPALVHCWHGADRTGLIVALYRMVYQDWSREAALEEMLEGDYGYHSIWRDIVKFIQRVDVRQLKADVYQGATLL